MLASLRVPLAVAVISFIAPNASEAQRGGGAIQLPDGAGKDLVQKRCVTCHPLGQIAGSAGYDQAGWKHVIESMIVLPADQMTTATEYLATHFPEKPGRRPTLVPGPVKVTFKEWMVPTLGQRSRDPLQMADGLIWWAGQYGSHRRPPQSEDRRDEGIRAAAGGETAQHHRRSRREHLVHGKRQRYGGQAEHGNRRHHRIQDARSERARSTYADVRSEGTSVVHASELEHGGPSDS